MPRALIALCLALQAVPARFTAASVLERASQPLPAGRRAFEIRSEGRVVGSGTWLVEGARHHVAFRNPLGQPTAILRIADGAVGLELVGDREIVEADAGVSLGDLVGGLDASALPTLLWGRLPDAPVAMRPVGAGFVATHPGFVAGLDREGEVRVASVGDWHLTRRADGVVLTDGDLALRLVLGGVVEGPVPEGAFRVGTEERVPSISTHRVGQLARRRLLGL
ncbi:MAG: hypothetical protein R3F61_31120 [Myxococcota bacterium]